MKCVCICMYAMSPTVLMLKNPGNAEFALWRNAEIKFEMNLLCKACFIIWKMDVGLPYFALCALHLSFLLTPWESNIILEGELSLDLELN